MNWEELSSSDGLRFQFLCCGAGFSWSCNLTWIWRFGLMSSCDLGFGHWLESVLGCCVADLCPSSGVFG